MRFYLLLQLLSLIISLAQASCNYERTNPKPSCGQTSYLKPSLYRHRHRNHHHRKIVAGRDAEPGEFPYQVMLVSTQRTAQGEIGMALCGGVIIDEQHILTAAHCVTSSNTTLPVEKVAAYVAAHAMEHPQYKEVAIQNFTHHSTWNYTETGHDNMGVDVALLRTLEPMQFVLQGLGSVNSICLPEMDEDLAPIGTTVTISGFGATEHNENAKVLQVTEVRVTNYTEGCGVFQRESGIGPEHYVCLATLDGRNSNACHGDSGGPAAIRRDGKWYLVGLTSRGDIRCDSTTCVCKSDSPTTFTRVSALIDWIEETKRKLAKAATRKLRLIW